MDQADPFLDLELRRYGLGTVTGHARLWALLLLLMPVLPQTLFALVGGHLVSFPLLTARHFVPIYLSIRSENGLAHL